MSNSPGPSYFETQVLTATPQRLRLLLIEGAIRFARQAVEGWNLREMESAHNSLTRCREILAELLSGVHPDGSELVRRTAALYTFLISETTHAELQQDSERLSKAISVLEIERETWQQLCEQLPATPVGEPTRHFHAPEVSAAGMKAILPTAAQRTPGRPLQSIPTVSSFSIEG